MTTRIKIVSGLLAVGLVAGATVAAGRALKPRFENELGRLLGRQVAIQSARLVFPAGVVLKKVVISADPSQENLSPVQIQEAVVQFGFLSLMQGRPFAVARLRIRDGEVTVVDRQISPEVTWVFRNVSAGIAHSHRPDEYLYTASAIVTDAQKKPVGRCEINGHFFLAGTTEATVSLKEMDLPFLAPYAKLILGMAPSQGACTLVSRVSAYQRSLLAESTLSASGVVFPTEQPTLLGPAGNRLVELLRDETGMVRLSFLVTGRPGEPLNWSELTAATIRESVRQGMAKGIQNVLSSTEQQPVEESVRKGLESIGH